MNWFLIKFYKNILLKKTDEKVSCSWVRSWISWNKHCYCPVLVYLLLGSFFFFLNTHIYNIALLISNCNLVKKNRIFYKNIGDYFLSLRSWCVSLCLCVCRSVSVLRAHRPGQSGWSLPRQHCGAAADELWCVLQQTGALLWGLWWLCAPMVQRPRGVL